MHVKVYIALAGPAAKEEEEEERSVEYEIRRRVFVTAKRVETYRREQDREDRKDRNIVT